jgi:ACS family hexuronate transporter-like MFS transporter
MQATVINYMDRIALNQMSKEIMAAFGLSNSQYSQLESVFSIAFAIGIFCTGVVVDRVSVRWVYPLMVLGWSAAGVLTGFAGSFWMLLTARFMLGLFESGNWPCALRTTRTVLPPEERALGNSLFGSGTALGAVITPMLVYAILRWAEANGMSDTWRVPFRVIGSLGIIWITLWFLTVPGRMLNPTDATGAPPAPQGAVRFIDVFRDRRFLVLLTITITVNITWHGYRAWLALYLQNQRGYTREAMSNFMTVYYLVADIGTWTVGFATLILYRLGMRLHLTRVLLFTGCAALASCTVAVPFLADGWPLYAGILVVGFGSLGLFPTYFALSQELSSKHQGKVTGTLGASAHLSLAAMYQIEGLICDATRSYEWVLGGVGLFPLLALGMILWLWSPWAEPPPSPQSPTPEEESDWHLMPAPEQPPPPSSLEEEDRKS